MQRKFVGSRRARAFARTTAVLGLGFAVVLAGLMPMGDPTPSFAEDAQTSTVEEETPVADDSLPTEEEDLAEEPPADELLNEKNTGTEETEEEVATPLQEDVEETPEQTAQDADLITPFSIPDFNANANVFYSLDRQSVNLGSIWSPRNTPRIRIRQMSFNMADGIPVAQNNVIMGGQRDLTALGVAAGAPRTANALGVTPDGVFYYTTQAGSDPRQPAVDVWRYEMMAMPGSPNPGGTCVAGGTPTGSQAEGWACAPQRVVSDLSLNSAGGGTIVGGAVNPRDGAFYFMYFSGTPAGSPNPPRNPYGEGNVRAHLYRYDENRSPVAGEVSHFDIRKNSTFGTTFNGDIAFDAVGNLLLTVSNNGGTNTRGQAMLATLNYDLFGALPTIKYTDPNSPSVPTLLPTSTVGAYGQTPRYNAANGNGVNGLAYTATGELVMQQGDSQTMTNPSTFDPIKATRTNGQKSGDLVDLASSTSPPVLTVQKIVDGERYEAGDQFTLSGNQQLSATNVTFDPITTTGDAAGLQQEQIGPMPVLNGGVITVKESIAPSANASSYSSEYSCFIENSDGSKGQEFASGQGREVSFNYFDEVPGANDGPQQMKCVFTNGPLRPDLKTSKSSDPETGSLVDEGQNVRYKLTFDNSTGLAPAEDIDFIDHLGDVSDDADFVNGSIRYGDGSETSYPGSGTDPLGLTATGPTDNKVSVQGTVPTGEIRTVWFEVKVKPNSENSDERDTANSDGYLLKNFLRPTGEEPPAECLPEDPNCTEHPIRAWTVSKSSLPADGSLVHAGANVNYKVEVQKLNPASTSFALNGIEVTDDLTDVLKSSHWEDAPPLPSGVKARGIYFFDASGNEIVANQLPAASVPAPTITPGGGSSPFFGSQWTLTTAPFDMPEAAVRAEIWYTIQVSNPPQVPGEWVPPQPNMGTTLTNFVAADSDTQAPNQCVTGEANTHNADACEVTHTLQDGFFTIRKDGVSVDGVETDLTGHLFEIRDDLSGTPGSTVSDDMCTTDWNVDPGPNADPSCAYFYPIESGSQAGRWRAQFLPEGTYWLFETKAPAGHQLLAEPIKFSVGAADPDGGRLSVYDSDGTAVAACGSDAGQHPVACVQPTGYLMVVKDPKLLPLPLSGGPTALMYTVGGALILLIGAASAVWMLKRRSRPHTGLRTEVLRTE